MANPDVGKDATQLVSEEEALARARNSPGQALPLRVVFAPGDRDNPRCWGFWRKWWITCFVSMLNVVTTWCAGGFSSGAPEIAEHFNVSTEVTTLCLSMYVLGYAVGPVLLAPLSEYYGRQPVYLISWFLVCLFQLPLALAPNIGTMIICRLLAGLAGGAPLTNTGGTVSDLWERNASGLPMAVYGLSSTFGPPMALVVTGYIGLNLGFRWIFWILMIITGFFWVLLAITVPETRHSIILQRKAARARKKMRREGLASASTTADLHISQRQSLHQLFRITLSRPFYFLFTEPITLFSALYNGFLYGLVYLFNEAFPLVFGSPNGHGFNVGQQGLAFLGLAIGPLLAFSLSPLQERYYLRRVAQHDGKSVPEARMWMARPGALLIPISLFWFGWTSYKSVHWIVPIIASSFFGAGSASALAGVILMRNLVGAGFPLFATQMYTTLGYEWASSLLGFLAILLVPIPFVFFYKGEAIRLRSPWAREHFDSEEDATH